MSNNSDLIRYVLENMDKDKLAELVESSITEPTDHSTDKLTAVQKYYQRHNIPGANMKCSSCGRDTITEQQAIELMGGDNN